MIFICKFRFFLCTLWKAALVFGFVVLVGASAWASTINIDFSPTPVERNIGDQWVLNIFLTGEIKASVLSQMHLDFMYDTRVINFNNATFGQWANTGWGHSSSMSFSTYSYGPNYHEALELSVGGSLYPPPTTLNNELYATVIFDAVGLGTSFFKLVGSGSSGCCGEDDWPYFDTIVVGQITVSEGTPPVPEPISMLLFGTGLVGVGGYVRRKFKK